MKRFYTDESGVEPTVMKILVGVILVGIGLGVGVPLYLHFGEMAKEQLSYRVILEPESMTLKRGESGSVDITVDDWGGGYEKTVYLAVDEVSVPSNVTVSFTRESGEPTFYSEMKIEIGSNASTGPYTITVRGTSGSTEKTARFDLTIG